MEIPATRHSTVVSAKDSLLQVASILTGLPRRTDKFKVGTNQAGKSQEKSRGSSYIILTAYLPRPCLVKVLADYTAVQSGFLFSTHHKTTPDAVHR